MGEQGGGREKGVGRTPRPEEETRESSGRTEEMRQKAGGSGLCGM